MCTSCILVYKNQTEISIFNVNNYITGRTFGLDRSVTVTPGLFFCFNSSTLDIYRGSRNSLVEWLTLLECRPLIIT